MRSVCVVLLAVSLAGCASRAEVAAQRQLEDDAQCRKIVGQTGTSYDACMQRALAYRNEMAIRSLRD